MKFRLRSDGNLSIGNFSAYAQADAYRKEMPKPGIWVVERIPPQPLALDDRERDTILAALRLWQAWEGGDVPPILSEQAAMLHDIAQNDHQSSLSAAEIDALCERLNTGG